MAVTLTALLNAAPLGASVSLWDDIFQETPHAETSGAELSGQVGAEVCCHSQPQALFQKHSGTLLGRAASLLWPASLSLLAPQGSWNAGHRLGAWACLSHLSVQAPLPTSCPQHAGTKPRWMETTPPLAGGLRCGTEGVGAGRGLSVHLLRRAGVHPGPLGPQGQRTLHRPAKSTGELWGLCGSKVWDGFPSLACWLLRGDKVATPAS